jgi:hypothetical protein
MLEKRDETRQRRGLERLLGDVLAYNPDEMERLRKSGFTYTESLEMMRNTREFKENREI